MYVRLAFATAIHVEPDVLIVDEALAVGDAVFANRCIRKLEELKSAGVSILFVSHDLGIVKRLCHRAVLLHGGEMIAQGEPAKVVNQYIALGPRTRPRSRRPVSGQPAPRRLVERDPERRTARRTGPAGNQRSERAAGAGPDQERGSVATWTNPWWAS